MRPQWRGCGRLLCYAMPPPSTTTTTKSSRWNERSASLSQSSVDERKRWQLDLFPLGHTGVALDRMETNIREEVFWSLKSGCPRWRTWLPLLSYVGILWMIKSCGWSLFRLFLHWIHRLSTTNMKTAWYRKCSLLFGKIWLVVLAS